MAQKQAITQEDRDWATNMNDPIAYLNPMTGKPVFQSQAKGTMYQKAVSNPSKAGQAGGSINKNTNALIKTKTNPIYNGGNGVLNATSMTSSTGAIQPLAGASQYQQNPAMGNMLGYSSSTGKPIYGRNGIAGSRGNYTNPVGSRLGVRY